MNNLQICQMAARESRVIPVEPTTLTGQVGKLRKIIMGVNDVYRDLQVERDWQWMRREFASTTLSIGVAKYTAAALGIPVFGRWAHDRQPSHAGDTPYYPYTIYNTALGLSDESVIEEITYEEWRVLFGRGAQVNNRPTKYAISPTNELLVGSLPDLTTYKINGEYYITPEDLTTDVQVPLLPEAYHHYLAWSAITRLREGDEAPQAVISAAINNAARIKGAIISSQTEGYVVGGGPIA